MAKKNFRINDKLLLQSLQSSDFSLQFSAVRDFIIKRLSEAIGHFLYLPQTEVWGFGMIIRSPT